MSSQTGRGRASRAFPRGLIIALGLVLLVASQLPMLAACAILLTNSDSEHEARLSLDGGLVHLTLHHGASPQARHRHLGCEKLLFGESEANHGDHELVAGSPETTSEPEPALDGHDVGIDSREVLSMVLEPCADLWSTTLACAVGCAPLDPPSVRRPGVVMRL